MSPWKAPGPDGYPAGFFQKTWHVIEESICKNIKQLWGNLDHIEEENSTYIVLIPKVNNPQYVS